MPEAPGVILFIPNHHSHPLQLSRSSNPNPNNSSSWRCKREEGKHLFKIGVKEICSSKPFPLTFVDGYFDGSCLLVRYNCSKGRRCHFLKPITQFGGGIWCLNFEGKKRPTLWVWSLFRPLWNTMKLSIPSWVFLDSICNFQPQIYGF